jgi:surfeit locus 1 family protein
MKSVRLWPVLLASALGLAILLSLGVWQVQRLAWKQNLIAQLEKSANASPATLTAALDATGKGEDLDYLRVEASGAFTGAPQFMLTSFQGKPGWAVIAPLQTSAEQLLLVDIGLIPEEARKGFSLPKGEVKVVGQILRHGARQGMFDPENDETAATWYWWDVPAMAAAASSSSAGVAAPFILHLEPAAALATGPQPQKLAANLRNNHLGYAITWFGLAAALLVITVVFVRRAKQKS